MTTSFLKIQAPNKRKLMLIYFEEDLLYEYPNTETVFIEHEYVNDSNYTEVKGILARTIF